MRMVLALNIHEGWYDIKSRNRTEPKNNNAIINIFLKVAQDYEHNLLVVEI